MLAFNIWDGHVDIHRKVREIVEDFNDGFDRVDNFSRPEEADLCLDTAAAQKGGIWIYETTRIVDCHVSAERTKSRLLIKLCFNEGRGKIARAMLNGSSERTAAQHSYTFTPHLLPWRTAGGLMEIKREDFSEGRVVYSAAITEEFSVTVGFLVASIANLVQAVTRRHSELGSGMGNRGSSDSMDQGVILGDLNYA